MTLEEAKALLTENGIPFELREFENEKAYWHHTALFPYTKNARPCRVMAVIIRSRNGKKNIELQFNDDGGNFLFEELRFGNYNFELFEHKEEYIIPDLLENIRDIMAGNLMVIDMNNMKKQRWIGDCCFDRNDEDETFGEGAFRNMVGEIRKPKGWLSRLLRTKKQYEIYDWNSYECIIK